MNIDPFESPCSECGTFGCPGHAQTKISSSGRPPLFVGLILAVALLLGGLGTSLALQFSGSDEESKPAEIGTSIVSTNPVNVISETVESSPEVQDAWGVEMLKLVNMEREEKNLDDLSWCQALSKSSAAHSADMARRKYFAHASPEGEEVQDRVKVEGYSYSTVGENIAVGQRNVAEVMKAWMNSPGHRANILLPAYSHFGLGYFTGEHEGQTSIFWTQNFGSGGDCLPR
jgi:uncharacterized protein YkwD